MTKIRQTKEVRETKRALSEYLSERGRLYRAVTEKSNNHVLGALKRRVKMARQKWHDLARYVEIEVISE